MFTISSDVLMPRSRAYWIQYMDNRLAVGMQDKFWTCLNCLSVKGVEPDPGIIMYDVTGTKQTILYSSRTVEGFPPKLGDMVCTLQPEICLIFSFLLSIALASFFSACWLVNALPSVIRQWGPCKSKQIYRASAQNELKCQSLQKIMPTWFHIWWQ